MTNTTAANGLALRFDHCMIAVEANDPSILAKLQRYFGEFAQTLQSDDHPHSTVTAIEEEVLAPDPELIPWVENGKEAFFDRRHDRVVRKVRTGVTITIQEDLWVSHWTVRGPIQRNFSQLVNMIGNIYGLMLMDHGASMIHASAVCDRDGRAVAIMGQSGMGKSSVAVRLMEQGFDYISNDRVLLDPAPHRRNRSCPRPAEATAGQPRHPAGRRAYQDHARPGDARALRGVVARGPVERRRQVRPRGRPRAGASLAADRRAKLPPSC